MIDDTLALLDEMNEAGRIEYDDYRALHDAVSVIALPAIGTGTVNGLDVRDWQQIAASKDEAVEAAVGALNRVRELHKPVDIEPSDTICGECSFQLPNGRYFGKVEEWPCPTLQALDDPHNSTENGSVVTWR